ncbi:hypothetical protein EON63_13710, partial [archaeon]
MVRQHMHSDRGGDRKKDLEVMYRNLVNIFSAIVPAAASTDVSFHSLQTCMYHALHTVTSVYDDGDGCVYMSATLMKYQHFILNVLGRIYNALAGRNTSSSHTNISTPDPSDTHTPSFDPLNQLCILANAYVNNMSAWMEMDGKVYVDCLETLVSVCVMVHTRSIPYPYPSTSSLLKLSQICMVCMHRFMQHCKAHTIHIPSSMYTHTNKLTYICSSLSMRSGDGDGCGDDVDLDILHTHGVLCDGTYTPITIQFMHAYIHTLKKHVQDRGDGGGKGGAEAEVMGYIESRLHALMKGTHTQTHMHAIVCLLARYFAVVYGGTREMSEKGGGRDNMSQYAQPIYTIFNTLIYVLAGGVKDMHASIHTLHIALTLFTQGEGGGACAPSHTHTCTLTPTHMLICAVLNIEWKNVCTYLTHNEMHVLHTYTSLLGMCEGEGDDVYDYHAVWMFNTLLTILQSYSCPHVHSTIPIPSTLYIPSSFLSSVQWEQFYGYIQKCRHALAPSPSSTHTPSPSKADFIHIYIECNDIINTLSLPPLLSHTDLYILKVYMALYVSKVIVNVYGDTYTALKHCRYCLSYIHKLHTPNSPPHQHVPITHMLHVEVLACMVDVYDHIGKAHRVMQYMGEMEVVLDISSSSQSLSTHTPSPCPYTNSSSSLNTIWSMYIHLRCMYMHLRLGSNVCAQRTQALMQVYGGMCMGLADVLRGMCICKQAQCVCAGMKFVSEAQSPSSHPYPYTIHKQALVYRHIPSPSPSQSSLYSTYMTSHIPSFDSLRTSRRNMCINTMSSNPFLSFMHHTASMHTTLEINVRHDMG